MNEQQNLSVARIREIEEKLERLSKQSLRKEFVDPKKIVLDHFEFLELFKISRRTSQHWRAQLKIQHSRIGGRIYFQLSDIRKLLEAQKVVPKKRDLISEL